MMHPEERERIEAVKLWSRQCLDRFNNVDKALTALAQGAVITMTLPNLPTSFGQPSLSLREASLRWHVQSVDGQRIFWVLDTAHQDAIYSVLKQWRQEQANV